jgi:hypothetical protein
MSARIQNHISDCLASPPLQRDILEQEVHNAITQARQLMSQRVESGKGSSS